MNKQIFSLFFLALILPGINSTYAQEQSEQPKVLFVYDKLDDQSTFFINTFRDELKALPCSVDEIAVEQTKTADLSKYNLLVLYSRVMAFDMKSPVRQWIKAIKSFNKQKVALIATANRWFIDKHFNQMKELLKSREADVIDAVSMATKNLSDEQKRAKVHESLVKAASRLR